MLKRDALEASPLADLHELAAEVGLEGFRRLRKADLIDRLLERAGGEEAKTSDKPSGDKASDNKAEGGRARSRSRGRRRGAEDSGNGVSDARDGDDGSDRDDDRGGDDEREVEAVVEVLANGTAFMRLAHPEQSDDDVYVSAAQVRRCELTSGDKISGPVRRPRRSEKYPSLIRVTTINGRPADEVTAELTRFEDQASEHPTERFSFGSDDVTLKAIEWLTPIGRGSRVVLHGPAHAGKTEALRLLAGALSKLDDIDLQVVLAGARPEEVATWKQAGVEPTAAALLGTSLEAQTGAIERALDQAKRVARRGADAVVLIDSVAELAPHVARRLLATARNLTGSGSVTVIASSYEPVGGETTLIAFRGDQAGETRFDLSRSTTVRADLLVGKAGAEAIAAERKRNAAA